MSGFFGKMMQSLPGLLGDAAPNAQNLVGDLIDQHGGVGGLVDKLADGGLGDKLQSLGGGQGVQFAASEIEQVFPPDQLDALAQKHGIPAGMVSQLLAQVLPHAVAAQAASQAATGNDDDSPN